MSDRRYSTSAWQKTREAISNETATSAGSEGHAAPATQPRSTTSPSSQRPDLFWDSDNLAAACRACNSGGGRRVGLENQRTNLLQIAGAIEQLGQRLYANHPARAGQRQRPARPRDRSPAALGIPRACSPRAAHLLSVRTGSRQRPRVSPSAWLRDCRSGGDQRVGATRARSRREGRRGDSRCPGGGPQRP